MRNRQRVISRIERDAKGRLVTGRLPDGRRIAGSRIAVEPVTRWEIVDTPQGQRLVQAEPR
jgi:hypothetical protein